MKTCPLCTLQQADANQVCRCCGSELSDSSLPPSPLLARYLINHALNKSRSNLFCRTIGLIIFTIWGLILISSLIESNYAGTTFLHNINLPFHEAGHVIFAIFGNQFLTSLGGTLGQLLVPFILFCGFFF